MWNCANCTTENRDNRTTCWHCSIVKTVFRQEPGISTQSEVSTVVERANICAKCSEALDDDARFCPSCASPVSQKCPSCEQPVVTGAKFCKYCAFDLSTKMSARKDQGSLSKSAPTSPQLSSGIEGLLADKYHTMSDSQLLTMTRGDLSGQTKRSLTIVLGELESRTSIDWRDAEVAKTRLKEAITKGHSDRISGRYPSNFERGEDATREKAERLAKAGGITAGISALLFLLGYSYTSSFANSARAGLMSLAGQTDLTYQLASLCVFLGTMGFIVGLILFVVGMAQRSS